MRFLYLSLSMLVVLLDRWTKFLVSEHLSLGESVPVLRNFMNLTHTQNPGIAFGIFNLHPVRYQHWMLIAVSAAAIGVVAALSWRYPAKRAGMQTAFALILGGAIGNLWDRIAQGKVTDFVDVFIGEHHWPVFNVADSAISIGVFVLAVLLLFFEESESPAKSHALDKQAGRP